MDPLVSGAQDCIDVCLSGTISSAGCRGLLAGLLDVLVENLNKKQQSMIGGRHGECGGQ